jgi:hypothetical protein
MVSHRRLPSDPPRTDAPDPLLRRSTSPLLWDRVSFDSMHQSCTTPLAQPPPVDLVARLASLDGHVKHLVRADGVVEEKG